MASSLHHRRARPAPRFPHDARADDCVDGRARLSVTIPGLEVQSTANLREHHMARYRRHERQRDAVLAVLRPWTRVVLRAPYVVTLTRVGPRRLDDDNAIGGFKAIRDAVAEWLGVDDGDTRVVTWRYDQARGAPREYAVRIEIEGRGL